MQSRQGPNAESFSCTQPQLRVRSLERRLTEARARGDAAITPDDEVRAMALIMSPLMIEFSVPSRDHGSAMVSSSHRLVISQIRRHSLLSSRRLCHLEAATLVIFNQRLHL